MVAIGTGRTGSGDTTQENEAFILLTKSTPRLFARQARDGMGHDVNAEHVLFQAYALVGHVGGVHLPGKLQPKATVLGIMRE